MDCVGSMQAAANTQLFSISSCVRVKQTIEVFRISMPTGSSISTNGHSNGYWKSVMNKKHPFCAASLQPFPCHSQIMWNKHFGGKTRQVYFHSVQLVKYELAANMRTELEVMSQQM